MICVPKWFHVVLEGHYDRGSCLKCGSQDGKLLKVSWAKDTSYYNGTKIPAKVLWYIPLKPRLQRLFMSSKTVSLMRWHNEDRTDYHIIRHPVDSPAWQRFDECHLSFSMEPPNVQLGLASDGFNLFSTQRTTYSTWPVVLIPYNLPPWLCMKQPYNVILAYTWPYYSR